MIHANRLCIALNLFQILLKTYTLKKMEDNDWYRASGECICPECERQYFEHPCHKEFPTFHILCNGTMVKT